MTEHKSKLTSAEFISQVYRKFHLLGDKLKITRMKVKEPKNGIESFSVDFRIDDKSQYLDSYPRSLYVLVGKFKLGQPKLIHSGLTVWEKDNLIIELQLQKWESGDNYPTTETQVIRVWQKNTKET